MSFYDWWEPKPTWLKLLFVLVATAATVAGLLLLLVGVCFAVFLGG